MCKRQTVRLTIHPFGHFLVSIAGRSILYLLSLCSISTHFSRLRRVRPQSRLLQVDADSIGRRAVEYLVSLLESLVRLSVEGRLERFIVFKYIHEHENISLNLLSLPGT